MTVTLLHSSAADDNEAEEHSITSSRLGGGVAALGALGACLELDGCEVRLCLPCARECEGSVRGRRIALAGVTASQRFALDHRTYIWITAYLKPCLTHLPFAWRPPVTVSMMPRPRRCPIPVVEPMLG